MKKQVLLVVSLLAASQLRAAVTITPANGGNAISADTAANAPSPVWTQAGPIIIEEPNNGQRGNFAVGNNATLVLKAPTGFEFNTAVTPDISFSLAKDITAASIAVTDATTITVTISVGGTANVDRLTIANATKIQVRPTAATPLARGQISRPATGGGTAVIAGITSTSNFGTLNEVPGAPAALVIQTQPTNGTAEVSFSPQPVIRINDQFGNRTTNNNSSVVTATRNAGTGSLLGSTSAQAVQGLATFTNLAASVQSVITIDFSSGTLPVVTSSSIDVAAAPPRPTVLVIQTQPSTNAVAGTVFGQQPVILIYDQYGNPFSSDNSTVVNAASSAGIGLLQGNVTATAVNGVATFTNLSHNIATNMTVIFSSGALTNAVSSSITITPATADRLAFTRQPGGAAFNTAFGIQPVVKSQDQFGNESSVDLPANLDLTVTLLSGTGTLLGATNIDIGTNAANGVAAFADLKIDSVGIGFQLLAAANGYLSATSAVFDVSKQPQTITFNGLASKTYGDAPFAVSATASSGLPVSFSLVSGPATISNEVVTITGAGTVTVRASQSGDASYGPAADVDQSFTVNKAVLTVSVDNQSRAYGAANPAFTASFSGFVNGEDATVLSGSPGLATAATAASAVGNYAISATNGTLSAANYDFAFVDGTLNITTAPLTVASDSLSRTYGAANPAFSGSISGLQNGDNITAVYSTSATETSPVGSYDIAITLNDPDVKLGNYSVTTNVGTLSVGAASLVVTANNTNKVVGTDNPTLTGAVTGIQNNDNITAQFTTTATTGSPVGTYPISVTLADPDAKLVNYNVTTNQGTLTVTEIPERIELVAGDAQTGIVGTTLATNLQIRVVDANSNGVFGVTVNFSIVKGGGSFSANPVVTDDTGLAAVSYTLGDTARTNLIVASATVAGSPSSVSFIELGTPAAAAQLALVVQPSTNAVAGLAFEQQPVAQIQDAFGNAITADNSTVITVSRGTGTAALQGTTNITVVNGVAAFTDLFYTRAETITLNFSAAGFSNAVSSSIVVTPATAVTLAFSTQPGSGRAGLPLGVQPVVRSRDQFGNNSSVGLSTNQNVTLTLSTGTGTLLGTTILDIGTAAGNGTAAFTDVAIDSAGVAKQLTAASAGLSNAVSTAFNVTGAGLAVANVSADTAVSGFSPVTGPTYFEAASGNVGVGTIILNAPAGFEFDTGGTAPTVRMVRIAGGGPASQNINGVNNNTSMPITSRTATQITFTVTTASSAGSTCSLTWQNIRLRALSGTPLTSGNLTKTGTSVMFDVTNSVTSFGSVQEVPGVPKTLLIQAQPSPTAFAGVVFAQQPVVTLFDQFNNFCSNNSTSVVTATRNLGTGILQGATNAVAANGVATFTNLSYNVAETITVDFKATTSTAVTSDSIVVGAGPADRLVFTTQPGSAIVGSPFGVQPVLKTQDQFGNNSTVGLPANLIVTVALTTGAGPLLGTISGDIAANNGVLAFTDLEIDNADPNNQLTASATNLPDGVSSIFAVSKRAQTITFDLIGNKTYGAASFGVTATASSGLPVSFSVVSGPASITNNIVTITGAGSVTIRASQAGDANYEAATDVDQTFTVNKALLTVSADNKSRAYGDANPPFTVTYNGFVNGEDVLVLSGTPDIATGATSGSPIGTYAITVTNGTLAAANYDFSFVDGILTVNPAALTVTADNLSRNYGAANPTLTGSVTGVVNGDNITANFTTTATTNSAVGNYQITATLNDPDTKLGNYTVTTNNGTLTVNAVALTVTADNKKRAVTAPNPTLTATITGLQNNDTITANLSTTATTNSLEGTYPITVDSLNDPNGKLGNYTVSTNDGTLTIVTALIPDHIVINAGDNQIAAPGATLAINPQVKVVDAEGFGVYGVNVDYTVQSGGGSINPTNAITDADGLASTAYTLGTVIGTNNNTLTATASSVTNTPATVTFNESVGSSTAVKIVIQTQPSTNAVAGVAFAQQPVIELQDEFGNVANADSITVVTASISTGSGVLLGTTNVTAVNGVVTFTDLSYNVAEDITINFTSGTLTNAVSDVITVVPNVANRLTIQTAPSSTNVAGTVFAQQPVLRIEDANGNLVSSDSSTVVTATRSLGAGTLLGTTTGTASGGVVTFTDLSYNIAETISISFAATGLSNVTSGNIVIEPAAVSQLAFTTQPGNGRTDLPLFTQPVVRTKDQFGNNSTVGLPANLAVNIALSSGTGALLGTTNLDVGASAGNGVAAFSGLQVDAGGLNKQLDASAAGLLNATSVVFRVGGVDPATAPIVPSSFVALTGPAYYEITNGNVGVGTIILNAPAGFEFDAGGTAPTVLVNRIGGGGSPTRNINGAANNGTAFAVTSRTATQITFTVTSASTSGVTCSLTWQNIRVRAVGIPDANNAITKTGTSIIAAVGDGTTSWGRLFGAPRPARLVVQTQPSSTATAGVAFAQQPVVRVEDQYGNLWTSNSVTVTVARGTGTSALQGTLTADSVNGVATFTSLSYNVAETISLSFASSGLTSATSSNVVVGPAAADRLIFTTQPGSASAGSAFGVQPVVKSRDQFGNDSAVGLGTSFNVTLTLSSGSGVLSGTTVIDIGTSAGNGVASFTDLSINLAGDKQITASAAGLTSAVSSTFAVAVVKSNQTITFAPLANKTFGDVPFTVSATASSGLPVSFSVASGPATISGNTVTITGAGTVTIRASQSGDASFNPAPDVDQSFAVAKANQTITFATLPSRNVGDVFTVSATASSGLAVTFGIVSGPATISGNTITVTNTGTVTVRASQAGDANYNAASNVDQSFAVKTGQTITFDAITNVVYGDVITLAATATSGLPVSFSLVSGSANLSSNVLTVTGVSNITVRASQAGDSTYNAAPNVDQTFTVALAPLVATANNTNRFVGEANPAFTGTIAGLKNNDNITAVYSTTADSSSPAGTYPITIALNDPDGKLVNYSVTTNNGVLTVNAQSAPFIVSPPQNQTVYQGQSVTFTVVATGGSLHYLWRKNGAELFTETNATLTISSAQLSDSAFYDVVVSNDAVPNGVEPPGAYLSVIVVPSDFDQNTQADILFQNTNGQMALWLMNDTNFLGTFLLRGGKAAGPGWKAVGEGDFDRDGQTDILFQNTNGGMAIWFMNRTNFLRARLVTKTVGTNTVAAVPGPGWRAVATGDANGDGKDDILLQNSDGRLAYWYMNAEQLSGAGLLRGGKSVGPGWGAVGYRDFNGDGLNDVLFQHTDGRLAVWFMDNKDFINVFLMRPGPAASTGWSIRGVADFNHDDKTDLVWQNTNGKLAVWFFDGTTFQGSVQLRNGLAIGPGWTAVGPR